MKKIALVNMFIIILIFGLLNNIDNYKKEKKLITDNMGSDYINVTVKSEQNDVYDIIKNLVDKYNIVYYYIDLNNGLLFEDYSIYTNSSDVIINEQMLSTDSCLSNKLFSECQKISNIGSNRFTIRSDSVEFRDGLYYFGGEDIESFSMEFNKVYQTKSSFNNRYYIMKIFNQISYVLGILILFILGILLILYKTFKDKKKNNLLLLQGYEKVKIIINSLYKFIILNLLIIIVLITLILFIYHDISSSFIFSILGILLIQMLLYYIFLNYTIDKTLIYAIKNKNESQKIFFLLSFIKVIFVILFSIIIINTISMSKDSIYEYISMNKALNIRNDYGQFSGTNVGNDTEDFFFSEKFYNLVEDSTEEILDIVDYFFIQVGEYTDEENNDKSISVITTLPNYFQYNKVYTSENSLLTRKDFKDDTCYFLIPEKYDNYNLPKECINQEIIKIKNDQMINSYDIYYNSDYLYGVVKDPVIEVFPKQKIKEYVTYDNIYYPLDKDGNLKNEEDIVNILKKHGIYDNTSPFYRLNDMLKYNFLGQKLIITAMIINIFIFGLILLFLLILYIKIYFENNAVEIILYKIQGYGVRKRYKKLIKIILEQIMFESLVILIIEKSRNDYLMCIIIILLINIILILIIIIEVNILEKRNINKVLKGG